MKSRKLWPELRRSLRSYLKSRRGGAMLVGGALMLVSMVSVGSLMSNYAWQEAQWEELRAATRAAISASARQLTADDATTLQEVADDIEVFLESMMACAPGQACLDVTSVVVAKDLQAGDATKLITVQGTFTPSDLWNRGASGSQQTGQQFELTVRADLAFERYEVAVALDVSHSMIFPIPDGSGGQITKMAALKNAMGRIIPALGAPTATTPGSLMVSVVPFASLVNVADTASNTPKASTSGAKPNQTVAKESYVRMLAGAEKNGTALSLAQTLAEARQAASDGTGQWVDTFQRYGVGKDMGPMRSQGLPPELLNDRDWNLRRPPPQTYDVRTQNPAVGFWRADDINFWNGCLMARWGAYWNETARPSGWSLNPDDPDNWPVRSTVPGWSPLGTPLADAPLHLSDAPPDAGNPHSLFTAYSWPDARIALYSDHQLQFAMATMLNANAQVRGDKLGQGRHSNRVGYNLWHIALSQSANSVRGGDIQCPKTPLLPLTKNIPAVKDAISNLQTITVPGRIALGHTGVNETYLVRGLVWSLRTLSPLWKNVWPIDDVLTRPGVSCASGEATGCDTLLKKSIILVVDGRNSTSVLRHSRTRQAYIDSHRRQLEAPDWTFATSLRDRGVLQHDFVCSPFAYRPHCNSASQCTQNLDEYHEAWTKTDEQSFNDYFAQANPALLDPNTKKFKGDVAAQAFKDALPRLLTSAITPVQKRVLGELTPWQLFRGEPLNGGQEFAVDKLFHNPVSNTRENLFKLEGRPTQTLGHCRPTSSFGPYGSVDDQVLISSSSPPYYAPVRDAAPFSISTAFRPGVGKGVPANESNYGERQFYNPTSHPIYGHMRQRLDDWFYEACEIAGQRGVRIHAVYIGQSTNTAQINVLEQCVDKAGGTQGQDDVLATPRANQLDQAFKDLFTVKRRLRLEILN